jgi:acetolactate synthase-1/3 small subunit
MKHVISALVENQPGVLARIVGLISGRGYNIESLTVAPTNDSKMSRMTLVIPGDDRLLEQVTKQLNKLINVIKVTDLTNKKHLDRELALIKVAADSKNREEVARLAELAGASVAAVEHASLTVQVVDTQDKVDEFLELLKPFKILQLSRSGIVAVPKDE